MPSLKTNALLSAVAGAVSVAAHGHVQTVIADGVEYPAFALSNFYNPNHPPLVGWSTTATDNGFVEPSAFTGGDIACHRDATNAEGSAVVSAGGEIFLQWDTWPESHKGPVIDMLASCGGADCASVDKSSLEFFKIQEVGLISGAGVSGTWASDEVIANGNGWLVKIPDTLAAGNYVLRHEIIALHASQDPNGAQNYPQCINIQVTGGGSDLPAGTVATSLYTPEEPGILFNLYSGNNGVYEIPGPDAPAIATVVSQSVPVATATSPAIIGGGDGTAPPTTPTNPPTDGGDDNDNGDDDEEDVDAPAPTPSDPAGNEPEVPSPTPSAPAVEEPEEPKEPEFPSECPTLRRRRARRAARAARRHARALKVKARSARV